MTTVRFELRKYPNKWTGKHDGPSEDVFLVRVIERAGFLGKHFDVEFVAEFSPLMAEDEMAEIVTRLNGGAPHQVPVRRQRLLETR